MSCPEQQKILLKKSQPQAVLHALRAHLEPAGTPDEEAPTQVCYWYIENHLHQLDYEAAVVNDLSVGSGEIESAHRYVIQKHFKIAGAWWLEEYASATCDENK